MPFNGSGTFNLVSPYNPVVTDTVVSTTWANATLNDVAAGLSNCFTRDGQSSLEADFPLGGFKLTSIGNGTVSAPGLLWAAGEGIYRPATGQLAIALGAAQVALFTPTGLTVPAINNTPIGATTPSTGAFTTLTATSTIAATGAMLAGGALTVGNALLTTQNTFFLGAFSVTVPILAFNGTGNGIAFDRAAGQMNFNVGGLTPLLVTAHATVMDTSFTLVKSNALRSQNTGGVGWSIQADGSSGQFELLNNAGTGITLSVSDAGDVTAGRNFVALGTITATGNMVAPAFVVSSSRELKDDIIPLDPARAFMSVMDWLPRMYRLKADPAKRVRPGLIVDEAPDTITDGEGHIDLYAAVTELAAAFQYLAGRVAALEGIL